MTITTSCWLVYFYSPDEQHTQTHKQLLVKNLEATLMANKICSNYVCLIVKNM